MINISDMKLALEMKEDNILMHLKGMHKHLEYNVVTDELPYTNGSHQEENVGFKCKL